MPPATRSQAAREAVATSDEPPISALHTSEGGTTSNQDDNGARANLVRMRQEYATQHGLQTQPQDSSNPNSNGDAESTNSGASSGRRRRERQDVPDEPPRFTIDLSLPPEQRYLALCSAFQSEIAGLVPLFDEVVGGMLDFVPLKWVHRLCWLLLRGVYDREENAELRGISKATGVSMYLLVCFNVLLDLFMGCSSGGAAVGYDREEVREDGAKRRSKMVHFRTLDWGMPSLRRVVVQLDFVLEKDGPVFASSITYAGYVGVLTGVRQQLSMSLNFRPNRIDNGVFSSDAKYVWHLLAVLLGWRRSISSTLRGFLLPRLTKRRWNTFSKPILGSVDDLPEYHAIVKEIGTGKDGDRPITTTACYLSFCNGKETTVIEKDRISAKVRSGDEFIVVTNTDETPPTTPAAQEPAGENGTASATTPSKSDELAEVLLEAQDRQECALHNWRSHQSARAREQGLQHITSQDRKSLTSVEDVVKIVQLYPTTNECTHFAIVMDPSEGKVVWCRRWKEPVSARWIREHMSATW